MMKRLLVFSILLFVCTSCGIFGPSGVFGPTWVKSLKEEGRKQPVKRNYKMSKQPFIYSDKIDTMAYYMVDMDLVRMDGSDPRTFYMYMRFSGNGLAFGQISEFKPTVKKLNDANEGQMYFYQVDGSKIKVEKYNHDKRTFEYWYGDIQEDGIYFYKYKFRFLGGARGKLNYFFRKHPADLTRPLVFPE